MAERARPDPRIEKARKQWKKCADAEGPQRAAILEAKNFNAGNQWPAAIKSARQGNIAIAGQPAQPPRPCLVVDRLSQPVRNIANTIKNADFGFDVLPNGGGADDETAEIFKGYMRRVHNNARGESPVEWAATDAIIGGLGWFRLRTEFVHDSWDGDPNAPEVFDQEIREERITNNLAVYCDPSSLHPTRRDAQFMFVVEDLDRDEFKRLYLGGKTDTEVAVSMGSLEDFISTGDMVGWVSEDTVRIAEWHHIDYENRTFCWLVDESVMEVTKDTPRPPKEQIKQERLMRVPLVKCDIINAVQVLDSYEWVGTRIPLFPILGEEMNVDGKPILRGIIAEGMDAQRMVNYTYSGAMEMFALAPKSPIIAAAGQIDPYINIWQTANIYNYSYLPYEPVSIAGDLVPEPHMVSRDFQQLQAAVELMRTSEEAVKVTTSTGDASLGNSHPNERSGRALQALQAQSELANSNYPDNVRRALIAAAEEMAIVIPKITRKGQIIQILGLDDEPKQVMVGQPFKEGPDGAPVASPPEITPEMARLDGSLHQFYDLNNGRYAVTVTVGKATATKREEGAAALGDLIPHLPPEMAAAVTPAFIEQLSFSGAHKIAELARKALPPALQEDNKSPLPPQVQAMVTQMQQQIQQLTQELQTDQAKQQATIQSTQIKAQSDQQGTQVKAQADMQLQQMKLQAEQQMAETKLRIEMDGQLQIEQMKAQLAIQLEQMKEEAAYRQAEMMAKIKAESVRRVSISRGVDGESTEMVGM